MNGRIKQLMGVIVVAIFVFMVVSSDFFQRHFYPDRYISKRVAKLEADINANDHVIRDLVLEARKDQIEDAQLLNAAEMTGKGNDSFRKSVADSAHSKMEDTRDAIAQVRAIQQKRQQELTQLRSPQKETILTAETKQPVEPPRRWIPEYIRIGLTMDDVIAIQGKPTEINVNYLLYGESQISFVDGCVSGWIEFSSAPLKTKKE